MTLFLFPSALTVMTHTLDSPGRYQTSNLFPSLPSWVFRELPGKEGGEFWGPSPLQEARNLVLQTFISPLLSPVRAVSGPWPGQGGGQVRGSLC